MSEERKKYVIWGEPIPLLRGRGGSQRKCWDTQQQQKLHAGLNIAAQHTGPLFKGALHLDVLFYFAVPKTSLKRQQEMHGTPYVFKPDLSSLVKYIEEVSKGILYQDDCLIASISTQKLYGESPRTEFTITELK